MRLLSKYLFYKIFAATSMVACCLVLVVWLTQSLRLIDFWMNRGVAFDTFLKLVLFVLPDLIVIILPISLLIGLVIIFSRILNDQELIIMRASGFSDQQIVRPCLWVALIVFTTLYVINLYILPASFKEFRELEHQIRSNIKASMLVPGEFNTFKGITIFIRERSQDGELKGILIKDSRDQKKSFTIMAQNGQVLESNDGALVFLYNGIRQDDVLKAEKVKPSSVEFDQYIVKVSGDALKSQERILKPYEMSIKQLFSNEFQHRTGYSQLKLHSEAHQRLLMPFLSFIFTIVVALVFLRGDFNRRSKSKKIAKIIGRCFLIEITTLIFLNLGEKHFLGIMGAYVTVLSVLTISIFRLLQDSLIERKK